MSAYSIISTVKATPTTSTSVDITGLFKHFRVTSVVEATPDFVETPPTDAENGVERMGEYSNDNWRDKLVKGSKFMVELHPLQLKTLIISLQAL